MYTTYQEGVLSVTEKTQYYEDTYDGVQALGKAGGKTLIVFNGLDALATANDAASSTKSCTVGLSCSLNLPIGIFNTNRPLFTSLYGTIGIDILFNGWSEFLCFSPALDAGGLAGYLQ